MPSYNYSATNDITGQIVKGVAFATSETALRSELKGKGLALVQFREVRTKQQAGAYKFKTKPLAIFTRQLASMLSAGVNLVRAVHILVEQEEDKKCRKLLQDVYEDLQKGNSFTDTLQNKRNSFPNLFIAMVAAGESSGNLDMIVGRVSDHYMAEAKTENTIKKAMISAIILAVLMIGIVLAMFMFILPMFVNMYEDASQIPTLSRILMKISDFIIAWWPLVIGGMAAVVIGVPRLLKIPVLKFWWDKTKVTAPKVGNLIGIIYTARFARTMSNLFASGLQMIDCIEKSVDVLGNDYVAEKFKVVVEDVKHGETLSDALGKTGIFSGIFVATVLIGEESGQLDSILEKSAEFYEEEANSAIESLVSMLEPVMIIIMGAMVGLVLAAIFPLLYGSLGGLAE